MIDPAGRGALVAALERAFSMEQDDAEEIAGVVAERFAETDEVDDESLDAEVRSVFYTLEAKRVLAFRREEVVRESGDKRRAFFWRLRPEALQGPRSIPVLSGDVDVYATLPPSAWRHAA